MKYSIYGSVNKTLKMNKQEITFDFPLPRPHCGVPLGNGNMGVLVWSGDNRLCLTLNRADFWDHRQGECVLPGQSQRID